MDMTQTEIDELRAAHARVTRLTREHRATDADDHRALSNALPRLLAALEEARAERDKADARIQQVHDWYADRWERLRAFLASGSLMEKGACDIMANGRLMIDAFPESPLALAVARAEGAEAERDALKAKLAALVKASQPFANDQGCDAVHHGLADRHDQRDTCPVVARLREALAAAKVQP